jgi:hypothetical protein
MRMLPIALVLGYALSAVAQTTISSEVLSDPLPYVAPESAVAAPAVALAKDNGGVAIAWSMPNQQGALRVHVARLDATGHVQGAAVEAPLFSHDVPVHALHPSLAADVHGSGFVIAWTELAIDQPGGIAAYCHLDASLRAADPRLLTQVFDTTTPVLVRSGSASTWVTANGIFWRINSDGVAADLLNGGVFGASDMVAGSDFPQLVSGASVKGGYTCNAVPGCEFSPGFLSVCSEGCRIYSYTWAMRFVALYTAQGATSFPFRSDALPAIGSDGRSTLVAWLSGPEDSGGNVLGYTGPSKLLTFDAVANQTRKLGTFGADSGPTRPDIATDGQRYVVVWRTKTAAGDHDIAGASIDHSGAITPLAIASSSADERDPSVIALGNGTFLVAYDKYVDGQRFIAGRFVTFGVHRRSVN